MNNHLVVKSTYFEEENERVKVNYSFNQSSVFVCEGFVYIPSSEYIDMRGKDIRKRICEDLIEILTPEKEYWEK